MTKAELKKVPFHLVSSVSMRDGHTLTYSSDNGKLGFAVFTPMRNGHSSGKTHRAYRIRDKWYEKYDEFLAALKDFHNAKIIKFEPKSKEGQK